MQKYKIYNIQPFFFTIFAICWALLDDYRWLEVGKRVFMEKKYDVFISYSSKDQKVAEGICGYLERYGLRCFVAYRDIPKGKVWAAAIADGIEESSMMVVVFSQNFNRSGQVDRELELAAEDKKSILTYRISNDPFTGAKKYYLKNLNWIDAFPNPQEKFGTLYNNVCQLLGKEPMPYPQPQPTPRPVPPTPDPYPRFWEKWWKWILISVLLVVAIVAVILGVWACKGKSVNAGGSDEKTSLYFTVGGVGFKMIKVEHGSFIMGATEEQEDPGEDEKPAHRVTLTNDYYIGETEVTQELWETVMGTNPSEFKGYNSPVECVSWDECETFIKKLNEMCADQLKERYFRLPTEAEWEYAARGGNKSCGNKYSGSASIDDVAWYTTTTNANGTRSVGTKVPNELGIFDMSGNVWEWCEDWYGDYGSAPQTDPQGPSSGSIRVRRGGSWSNYAEICRVSCRGSSNSGNMSNYLGFRLVLIP